MTVGGVLLAAGGGRRFGMPKALVEVDGRPLVRAGAATLADGGCDPVVVVVGAAAVRVRALVPGLTCVDNPDWASGMGSSLRAGLGALVDSPADAALILLVDMPGVTAEAVRRVAAAGDRDALVMGGYGGRRGHPVLLGRAHWAGVMAGAVGDRGARDYLREHADRVRIVEVGDVADDRDIDEPIHLMRSHHPAE